MSAAELPSGAFVVVALARHPRLPAALADAAARGGPVLVVTDDVEALPPLPAGVIACEPERFLDGGTAVLDASWDADVDRWLRRLYPGELEGEPLGPLLLVNLFRQPGFVHRNYDIALARALLRTVRPRALQPLGTSPFHCHMLADAARAAGVPLVEPTAARLRRGLARATRWPAGFAVGAAYAAFNAAKLVAQLPRRRAVERRLAERGFLNEASVPFWVALTPGYIQPSRHLCSTALAPDNAARDAYGLLYYGSYGIRRRAGDQDADELSLVDGSADRLRPAAVDQVAGAVTALSTLATLARWAPLTVRAIVGVIAHADTLVVDGVTGSRAADQRMLLRVATGDLLRTVDAAAATRRWLGHHAGTRCVIFNNPTLGESKIADLMMQSRGVTTIDYPHGYISEGNMRTSWPSRSTMHLAWTREQATQLAALGLHRENRGGYLPWAGAQPIAGTRPRVLVVSGYWWHGPYIQNLKYARRLARAVAALAQALGDAAEVRVRLHPLDDRTAWRGHFAPGDSPPLSTMPRLADDLARADLVLCTLSSAFVEALRYGVPVLMHRGPAVERGSLFARVPPERWFADGDELVAKVRALLPTPRDVTPERMLAEACFGPDGEPESVLALVESLLQRDAG